MAKKFNEVIIAAKKTTYGNIDNILVTAASKNSGVKFTPVLSPNGENTTEKYVVHTALRNKSKTIGTSGTVVTSTNDTGSMTVEDNNKVLNSFGKFDWDSTEIVTGTLKGIGHKIGFNDEYDADSLSEVQSDFIESEVGNIAIDRKESLLNAIIETGSGDKTYSILGNAAAAINLPMEEIDFTGTGSVIFDAVTTAVRTISQASDVFKHRVNPKNLLILVDTETKDKTAKELGVEFLNEAPIYKTGLMSQFSINGVPVIEVPELDQYLVDTDKNVKVVVCDPEGLAFEAANEQKGVDVNQGVTRFVGNLFYDITAIVPQLMNKRIKVLHSTDTAKVAAINGVNA